MKRLLFVISLLLIPSICLAGKTGILEVYSEPPGAEIYIDGIYVGITPYQNLETPIGRHEIRASLTSEYPEQRKTITVTEEDAVTRAFYFFGRFEGVIEDGEGVVKRYTGRVIFASTPPGALIHLRGRPPVKAPKSFNKADIGRYEVKFTLHGKTLKGSFDVIKNETVQIVADFNKGVIVNINKGVEEQKEKERQEALARLESERQERVAREEIERREVERKRQAELARLESERLAREETERRENINRKWISFLRTIEGNIWIRSRGIPCILGKDLYLCLQNYDQDDITIENIKNKIIEAKQKEGRSVDLFYTRQIPKSNSITVAIYFKVNGNTLNVYSKQTCSGILCGDREDSLITASLPYNEGPF